MYVGRDFDPSDTGEAELYEFDFIKDLRERDTITAATWSCKAASISEVADPNAADCIIGDATFSGTKTQQVVSGLKPGVTYMLRALVTTQADDRVSLWAHVECREPA